MHIAALQYEMAWEDKAESHRRLDSMLDDANLPAETYLLLPEMTDTGFSFNLDAIVDDRSIEWARQSAKERRLWIQMGYPELGPDGKGRNCATIINPDGDVVGTYRKIHPFGYQAREVEFFSGGDRLVLRRCGEAVVCPLVCYDLRFPELFRLGVVGPEDRGKASAWPGPAEIFPIGASWPAARQPHWRSLLIARAIENQAYVIGVNRCGADPHIQYAGGSIVVSPKGEVLAEAGDGPEILRADLDLEALRVWRRDFPALRDLKRPFLGDVDLDLETGDSVESGTESGASSGR